MNERLGRMRDSACVLPSLNYPVTTLDYPATDNERRASDGGGTP